MTAWPPPLAKNCRAWTSAGQSASCALPNVATIYFVPRRRYSRWHVLMDLDEKMDN